MSDYFYSIEMLMLGYGQGYQTYVYDMELVRTACLLQDEENQ